MADLNPRDLIKRKELSGTKALAFPPGIDDYVPNFFELKFVNYERNATLKKATETPNSVVIFLPIPADLQDSTSLSYEEYDSFGGLDNILNQSNPSDAAKAASASGKGFMAAAILGTMRYGAELIPDAVKQLTNVQVDGGIGKRLGQVAATQAGAAINPALAVEFKGVQRKSYSFSWRMVAKSADESRAINSIIDCIRWNVLPEKVAGDWILTYPNIAFMKFHGNIQYGTTTAPRQIIQFAPQGAVVTNFTVLINGSSGEQVFFRDTGEPIEVAFNLQLQDRGILTREMVDASWQSK